MRTAFEKWLHVLKFSEVYGDRDSEIPRSLKDEEGIEMAVRAMRDANASDKVREMIEFRSKAEHDEATRLESARLDGLEEGMEEGMEKGLEKGLEKGQREALKATARKMREAGLDAEMIQRITGLTLEDLDDEA